MKRIAAGKRLLLLRGGGWGKKGALTSWGMNNLKCGGHINTLLNTHGYYKGLSRKRWPFQCNFINENNSHISYFYICFNTKTWQNTSQTFQINYNIWKEKTTVKVEKRMKKCRLKNCPHHK